VWPAYPSSARSSKPILVLTQPAMVMSQPLTGDASFIHVAALRKSYALGGLAINALDGVNLRIAAGTFSVIMGPSGSGKSTLLYLLGGLDRPSSGEIVINQQRIDTLNENELAIFRRRTVGFIFQSFNLIPTMSALDNVAFPMRFDRRPRSERRQQAYELLCTVGLSDRIHHKPTELSGGQQQRVAVARALVNNPNLVLADEPTGNLDSSSGTSIMQILSDLHQSGRTVVVVTHDPRMEQFSTHTVHLLDGRVTEDV
jgi:putative ABC transport system ATP-binding protein